MSTPKVKEVNVTTVGAKVYEKTSQERLDLKQAKADYKKFRKSQK